MASAAMKRRENLHTDIGMVGRRTGFTVKSLPRNDDGMENLSAFFSSPRPEPESSTEDDLAEELPGDKDEVGTDSEIGGITPLRRRPSEGDATTYDLHDDSAPMDVEDSSARSLVDALESRRGHTTNSPRKSYPGLDSPAKRKSTISIIPPTVLRSRGTPSSPSPSLSPSPTRSHPQRRRGIHMTTLFENPSARDTDIRDESKENLPRVSKTRKKQLTSAGLRSIGHGGRLATQVTNRHQSDDGFSEQSEQDEQQSDGIHDADRGDTATFHPLKPTLYKKEPRQTAETTTIARHKNEPVRQRRQKERNILNYPDTSQNIGPKALTTQRSEQGEQSENPTQTYESILLDASATNTSHAKATGLASTSHPNLKHFRPNKTQSTLSEGQGAAANMADTASVHNLNIIETSLSQKRRAGRPKKAHGGQPKDTEVATQVHPVSEAGPGPMSHAGTLAQEKNTSSGQVESALHELGRKTTALSRGRKRKANLLNPEEDATTPKSAAGSEHFTRIPSQEKQVGKKSPVSTISNLITTGSKLQPRQVEADRPKRLRIAPLQFWKNEKRVYTVNKRRESGTAISLTEQVVRIEDAPAIKPPKKTRNRLQTISNHIGQPSKSGRRRAPNLANEGNDADDADDDSDDEDWEKVGKLVGMVRKWPSENNNAEEDEFEDEIAISRNGIEFKPIFGSDYLFAKTMGKEFMGCGILELQTGAIKKLKSSGKMQLVFFVLEGKIEAEVNELGFRIKKGGQFQVPRGNMYKISNPFRGTARIFFAQACIPELSAE